VIEIECASGCAHWINESHHKVTNEKLYYYSTALSHSFDVKMLIESETVGFV